MPASTQSPRRRTAGRKPPRRLARPQLLSATMIDSLQVRFDFDAPMIFQSNAYDCFSSPDISTFGQTIGGRRTLTVLTIEPVSPGIVFSLAPDPAKLLGENGLSPIDSTVTLS